MSLPQIRCALAACNRRDASLALTQLDVIQAAVAPLAVGDKGMPAYDRCFNWLMRFFRKPKAAPAPQAGDFATLAKSASRAPLTPAEASFAAAARARLSGR
jgi:hypothetical protein